MKTLRFEAESCNVDIHFIDVDGIPQRRYEFVHFCIILFVNGTLDIFLKYNQGDSVLDHFNVNCGTIKSVEVGNLFLSV